MWELNVTETKYWEKSVSNAWLVKARVRRSAGAAFKKDAINLCSGFQRFWLIFYLKML